MLHNKAGARVVCTAALFVSILGFAVAGAPPAGAAVRDVDVFACAPGLTSPFTDTGGTTHAASIACAVHYDITSGTTATAYGPDGIVSRGQMATFIARVLGGALSLPEPTIAPPVFTDTAGSAHEESVSFIVELGIAQGTSPTTFAPSEPVSRAQMARFLARTIEVLGFDLPASPPNAFTDDDGNPHEDPIDQVADLGIAGGTTATAYAPSGIVSRAAMASFLVRLIDFGIEHGLILPFVDSEAYAFLEGEAEVPAQGDLDGVGTAQVVTTDVPGVVCVMVDVAGIEPPVAAHIHSGAVNASGGIVVTLPTPAVGAPAIGCVSDSDAAAIAADPEAFYVNVHTNDFPDGALRGQLGGVASVFEADMDDDQVVPGPGEPDAFGFAFAFTTTQPDVVCLDTLVFATTSVTAVHLHEAALHANGPEVLSFTVDEVGSPPQCMKTTRASALAADPSDFYVDAHTSGHPDGAVRGQLRPATGE